MKLFQLTAVLCVRACVMYYVGLACCLMLGLECLVLVVVTVKSVTHLLKLLSFYFISLCLWCLSIYVAYI